MLTGDSLVPMTFFLDILIRQTLPELESISSVAGKITLSKLLTIMDNETHPLYNTIIQQKSLISWRL